MGGAMARSLGTLTLIGPYFVETFDRLLPANYQSPDLGLGIRQRLHLLIDREREPKRPGSVAQFSDSEGRRTKLAFDRLLPGLKKMSVHLQPFDRAGIGLNGSRRHALIRTLDNYLSNLPHQRMQKTHSHLDPGLFAPQHQA